MNMKTVSVSLSDIFIRLERVMSVIHRQLSELQSNEYDLKTLNVPVEEGMFRFEVDEDLFEQLYLVRENLNKPNDLN